jgi:hypothetical protein
MGKQLLLIGADDFADEGALIAKYVDEPGHVFTRVPAQKQS